jgi:SAM-dependent methyltransferase
MQDWDARTEALAAPAVARNREAILAALRDVLPASGTVLEVASGTGEHVVHFAAALPALTWQPSDPEPAYRRSIAAHARAAGLANLRPPLDLDAASAPWPIRRTDAILCINMIHIAPWAATLGLMEQAGRILAPGGPLFLYGAFRENGRHTTDSNAAFDADLQMRDPRWGVRDFEAVVRVAEDRGLRLDRRLALPANNLGLVFRRTAT